MNLDCLDHIKPYPGSGVEKKQYPMISNQIKSFQISNSNTHFTKIYFATKKDQLHGDKGR